MKNITKLVTELSSTLIAVTLSVFLTSNALAKDINTTPYGDSTNRVFKMAVLPDTQYYSMLYPDIFRAQTKWIADNYKSENIRFTMHLGDIVQDGIIAREWAYATRAMAYLDANKKTPYSILSGNHDVPNWFVNDANRNKDWSMFLKFFPVDLQKMRFSTFKGSDTTGFNSYHIFKDNLGNKYLVLALDWRVSKDTLDWADGVLKKHSKIPTILTTHEMLEEKNSQAVMTDNGKYLWNNLIKNHNQIFLALCGHNDGESYLIKQNNFKNNVTLMLLDYQGEYKGGNGMMAILSLDRENNELNVSTYSPWVESIPENERGWRDELTSWSTSISVNIANHLK